MPKMTEAHMIRLISLAMLGSLFVLMIGCEEKKPPTQAGPKSVTVATTGGPTTSSP
jgi:hypothetical protein